MTARPTDAIASALAMLNSQITELRGDVGEIRERDLPDMRVAIAELKTALAERTVYQPRAARESRMVDAKWVAIIISLAACAIALWKG